jgi:hypothetical protein
MHYFQRFPDISLSSLPIMALGSPQGTVSPQYRILVYRHPVGLLGGGGRPVNIEKTCTYMYTTQSERRMHDLGVREEKDKRALTARLLWPALTSCTTLACIVLNCERNRTENGSWRQGVILTRKLFIPWIQLFRVQDACLLLVKINFWIA